MRYSAAPQAPPLESTKSVCPQGAGGGLAPQRTPTPPPPRRGVAGGHFLASGWRKRDSRFRSQIENATVELGVAFRYLWASWGTRPFHSHSINGGRCPRRGKNEQSAVPQAPRHVEQGGEMQNTRSCGAAGGAGTGVQRPLAETLVGKPRFVQRANDALGLLTE
eukprot:gene7843-biopygen1539